MGWPAVKMVWLGDVAMRFDDTSWQTILLHLLEYPLEIAVCTLPWSPLLVAFLSRRFRRSFGDAASMVEFLGLAIGLAFVTCWIVPGARGRYFMPLYPCMALLVGLSVERIARPVAANWQLSGWRWFLLTKAFLAIGAGVLIAGADVDRAAPFSAAGTTRLVRVDFRCCFACGRGRACGHARISARVACDFRLSPWPALSACRSWAS